MMHRGQHRRQSINHVYRDLDFPSLWSPTRAYSHPATHHQLPLHSCCDAKSTGTMSRLAALGDTALDVVPLDVVGVVGLDIGSETVEGALDGFLGGRVHHAGLHVVSITNL